MHLQGLVGHAPRELAGVPLGHGDLADGILPGDQLSEGVVGEGAGGLEVARQIGEAMPPHLEPRHRPPEGLALARVGDPHLQDPLGARHRAQSHGQPLPLEVVHQVGEAPPLLAEEAL